MRKQDNADMARIIAVAVLLAVILALAVALLVDPVETLRNRM